MEWKEFLPENIVKSADTNDPPMSAVKTRNGRVYASYDPRQSGGPLARRTYGRVIPRPEKDTFLGMKTLTIDDEAKNYQNDVSDPYYHNILVGGANAGGTGFTALSRLPFGVLAKAPNREVFRNGEVEKIREAIDRAIKGGKHVRVLGHSWGGADVARMAKDYPDIPFFALDPVSWTGRIDSLPKNLTILRPDGSDDGFDPDRLAQIFGGQWPKIEKGEGKTVVIPGSHTTGFAPWLTKMNKRVMDERLSKEKRHSALQGLAMSSKKHIDK